MTQNTRDILNIVKSGITGKKLPVSSGFSAQNSLDLVYKHKITNIFYNGLVNCGLQVSNEVKDFCLKSLFYELSADTMQQNIINEITSIFNENEIDHMLLKGSVIKKLYIKPEMRRMGDIDILIRQKQYGTIKRVLLANGYAEQTETDHEYKWTKAGVLVELHKRLVATEHEDLYSYYGDWFEKAVIDDKHSYKMTDEDFLIFLFVHFTKHYRKTGIGIMHMCDLYVFLTSKTLDNSYINTELNKLGLLKFYENIKLTIDVWFKDLAPTEMTDHITSVIFASGVYGTYKNEILSQALKSNTKHKNALFGKTSRILNVLFPPYSSLKNKYNSLKKFPFLLPVFWVIRGFDLLLHGRNNIKIRIDDFKYADNENVDNYLKQLEYVGLNFELNKNRD